MGPVNLDIAKREGRLQSRFEFSICTMVNNAGLYEAMVSSFVNAGFTTADCEYRYVDNTGGNDFDAYQALNLFLQNAQGRYLIICHQDIALNFDNRERLQQCINEVGLKDKNWAVLSNAGGIENSLYKRYAFNVVYADGVHHKKGTFPQKAVAVDESFILVKRDANLALSGNLGGFHLYGTDLCLIADLLGYSAYIIDYKITHKSYGKRDGNYQQILTALIKKYTHFMRSRRVVTTITDFYLSSSGLKNVIAESKLSKKVFRKIDKIRSGRNGNADQNPS